LGPGHREGSQGADISAALNVTSSVVSANTCTGEPMARLSRVGITEPSIEFSIGTHA
jgi:hypothetical protein